MFTKKTLQQQINDFKEKVYARETKISSRISELEAEAASIKAKVKAQTAEIVELEMSGNSSDIGKLQKSNREMRMQLEEIQDSIQEYKDQLEDRTTPFVRDLEKLRIAGNKAAEERLENEKALRAESAALETQIEDLKSKLKKINSDLYISGASTEVDTLKQIAVYIDPRATGLGFYEGKNFINNWLGGASLKNFFK